MSAPELPVAATFLDQYYREVDADELTGRSPADLRSTAASHRALGADRAAGRALVRVADVPPDSTEPAQAYVQIVTDDMPFLIDSIAAELFRQGYRVGLIVHPQFVVRRQLTGELLEIYAAALPERAHDDVLLESWIHAEIDPGPDAAGRERLQAGVLSVLTDVREAVEDWSKMRATALAIGAEIESDPPPRPPEESGEAAALLRWLADDKFTFLGYREYDLVSEDGADALRTQPGSGLGILRSDREPSESFAKLPPEVRAHAREPQVLFVTKANSRATVHRPHYLDYIGIKRFGPDGAVVGERRFLGLWSHSAYRDSVYDVPLVRRTVGQVIKRSGLRPGSYSGKDLAEVLETYPRDELFQIAADELAPIAFGVLHLQERRRVRLFTREDIYRRFVSCLIYLPRDRYTTRVRERIQNILLQAYAAAGLDYTARVSESSLARLHFVVRAERGKTVPQDVDVAALQERIVAAVRSFEDDLAIAIGDVFGDAAAAAVRRYAGAFPEAYKEDFRSTDAAHDAFMLDSLTGPDDLAMELYSPPGAARSERRFKVFHTGAPSSLSLSAVLPMLQRLGVEVVDERPYQIDRTDADRAWIYDFGLIGDATQDVSYARIAELFRDAFAAMWRGRAESDGFNALVLRAGLSWRQVTVLRAYCKYLRQISTTFSFDYIIRTVSANPRIAIMLVRLFETRFALEMPDREQRCGRLTAQLTEALDALSSLDEDRILRSYLSMITATLRTNYFQTGEDGGPKAYLSLKLDSRRIAEIPQPRPAFEIFVYSPRTEAVHLRFGPVARGGLRWSDRLEDFRTEVLGLVKAQTVKNVVIVPVGAKGGFVIKRPPPDRAALAAEVLACYREFNCGMLDITDNLIDGEPVPPRDIVRHDGDDPYLVVAADKGTATFSDVANGIAKEYGFWLGDAYASGGSAGYDHKVMGITARGAWESVKHHFRALGIDCQQADFSCVGIGDMSGDVFGNGMLLSRHARLVAAFDHRHIFVDPDPDAASSFLERQRMFALPGSSWADYDTSLISAGGGVFARTAKSVPVSSHLRTALGLAESVTKLTPAELMRAILRAPVQLLWNGGIGTYVRASTETDLDVGDKSNDAVRITAAELRCDIVGEGGNVGLTQLGRVEFALCGGLINTDAIDNSAGVDTSDHEVNIKILLDRVVQGGSLTVAQRNDLLASMSDEVAALVLRDNYEQNVAIAASQAQASSLLHVHRRYVAALVADGVLDRTIEHLPDEAGLDERRVAGIGLTGPEFAVLLAYTKISLTNELLETTLPDDPYLREQLMEYFPRPLREQYAARIDEHPLRREIIVTGLVNHVVNFAGTTFAFRVTEETAANAPEIMAAFVVVFEVFGIPALRADVEALDNKVDAAALISIVLEVRKLTERATRWLLHNRRPPFDIAATIEEFGPGVRAVLPVLPGLLTGDDREGFDARRDRLVGGGVPRSIAERSATAVPAFAVLDLVDIGERTGVAVTDVAACYFYLGERLAISALRDRVTALPRDDRWHTMARNSLRDDVYASHAALCEQVLRCAGPDATQEERFAVWAERNHSANERARLTLADIAEVDKPDVATLSIAVRTLRTLATAGTRTPG